MAPGKRSMDRGRHDGAGSGSSTAGSPNQDRSRQNAGAINSIRGQIIGDSPVRERHSVRHTRLADSSATIETPWQPESGPGCSLPSLAAGRSPRWPPELAASGPILHGEVPRYNLRPLLVGMRDQFQLHDPRPLDVLLAVLMGGKPRRPIVHYSAVPEGPIRFLCSTLIPIPRSVPPR